MNEYFSSVFTEETFNDFQNVSCLIKDNIYDIHCTTDEVERYLKNVDENKSPGPDAIPSCVLKKCAPQLAPRL